MDLKKKILLASLAFITMRINAAHVALSEALQQRVQACYEQVRQIDKQFCEGRIGVETPMPFISWIDEKDGPKKTCFQALSAVVDLPNDITEFQINTPNFTKGIDNAPRYLRWVYLDHGEPIGDGFFLIVCKQAAPWIEIVKIYH